MRRSATTVMVCVAAAVSAAGCGGDREPALPAAATDDSVQVVTVPARTTPAARRARAERRGRVVARFGAGTEPDAPELTRALDELL